MEKMQEVLHGPIVDHVHRNLQLDTISTLPDIPWWTKSSSGNFTVGSAWELVRQRNQTREEFSNIWTKGVPYKISFFLWRLWKYKLPMDEVLQRMKINLVSKCRCCKNPQEEKIVHLFITGEFASSICHYYTGSAGILGPFMQLQQAIKKWWSMYCSAKLQPIYQAASAFICWQLWKSRNLIFHGGVMSRIKVIEDINNNIVNFARLRYPWMKDIPSQWHQLIQYSEDYRPQIQYQLLKWERPKIGWFKCNTDGASRGNPGESSAAFCVRNLHGDLVCAGAKRLSNTTSIIAEAVPILNDIQFCISQQKTPVLMESDSLATINILEDRRKTPWSISIVLECMSPPISQGSGPFTQQEQ